MSEPREGEPRVPDIDYQGWIASDLSVMVRRGKVSILDRGEQHLIPIDTLKFVYARLERENLV